MPFLSWIRETVSWCAEMMEKNGSEGGSSCPLYTYQLPGIPVGDSPVGHLEQVSRSPWQTCFEGTELEFPPSHLREGYAALRRYHWCDFNRS